MTKQYFYTLLRRVGVSSLIGMAVVLLVVACPELETSKRAMILQKQDDGTTKGDGTAKAGTGGIGIEPSIVLAKASLNIGEITVAIIRPDKFGTNKNGTPFTDRSIKYWLYYAKSTTTKTADEIATIVNDATVITGSLAATDPDKGAIELDPDAARTITNLTAGAEYYFFVRIIHPTNTFSSPAKANEGKDFARDTKVKNIHAKSYAMPVNKVPTPTFNHVFDNTRNKFKTTPFARATIGGGKKANGKSVNDAETDVGYTFYYASGTNPDDFDTAHKVKDAAIAAKAKVDDKTGGVEDIIAGGLVEVSGKDFVGDEIYAVVEAYIKTDTSVFTLSDVGSYKIAKAPSAVRNPVVSNETTTSFTVKADPPEFAGRKVNGDPVDAKDIKYELYYAKFGRGYAGIQSWSTGPDVVKKVGTKANDVNIGKLTGITGTAITNTGFVVTGLTVGKYRYVIRAVHPVDTELFTDAEPATEKLVE